MITRLIKMLTKLKYVKSIKKNGPNNFKIEYHDSFVLFIRINKNLKRYETYIDVNTNNRYHYYDFMIHSLENLKYEIYRMHNKKTRQLLPLDNHFKSY